jgi:ABC-type dipeptide/oligopeptide/nickel transport system permease subunit
MDYLRGGYRLAALSLIALFCSTTPLAAQPPPREPPRLGGVLKIAMIGEPPSLDPHWTTAVIAIMLTILGLNLLGDGLRDVLDPKIRSLQTDRQPAG